MVVRLLCVKIIIAFLIDCFAGDPQNFPHPVRLIGKFIENMERLIRRFGDGITAGAFLAAIVVASVTVVSWYVSSISAVIEVLLMYSVLAVRSLGDEAMKVHDALASGDVETARSRIAMLVSRDTAGLDEQGIVRAAVETVAENIVDAVISPLFYLFLGGVPAAYAYKAASTLDSMVGYRNDRYLFLGRPSARLDDVLNFVPSRVTAFVIIPLAAFFLRKSAVRAIRIVMRDRHNHASPNSGHPEAAVAGALGIQLGGPASYFGKMSDKPTIGDPGHALHRGHIRDAVRLMYAASIVWLMVGCVLASGVRYLIKM